MTAAIFDLDGLLIDSEPLWRRAEVDVFGARGVPLTDAMCHQTTGLRMDEVVAYWQVRFPDVRLDVPETMHAVYDALVALTLAHGREMSGASAAVRALAEAGVPLALASSSPMRVIDAALERLSLSDVFPVRVSAEDDRWGKPHPGVYLRAAAALGLAPTQCVAFEDSLNGLIAAKAARMRCVLVPDPRADPDARWALADEVHSSLWGFDADDWRELCAADGALS